MGGDGVYWLGLSNGKYEQLRLFDPNKGSHEINVWTSDQGFADEERYVTYDRELVLRIARYFEKRVNGCRKHVGGNHRLRRLNNQQ